MLNTKDMTRDELINAISAMAQTLERRCEQLNATEDRLRASADSEEALRGQLARTNQCLLNAQDMTVAACKARDDAKKMLAATQEALDFAAKGVERLDVAELACELSRAAYEEQEKTIATLRKALEDKRRILTCMGHDRERAIVQRNQYRVALGNEEKSHAATRHLHGQTRERLHEAQKALKCADEWAVAYRQTVEQLEARVKVLGDKNLELLGPSPSKT